MTEIEAIKRINECRNTPNFQPYHYVNEALEMGIKALEKQIAKKPLLRLCDNCQVVMCISCDRNVDRCPSCNGDLYVESGLPYKYCPKCGQALDWGNEDAE